jgi:hypothetical protein
LMPKPNWRRRSRISCRRRFGIGAIAAVDHATGGLLEPGAAARESSTLSVTSTAMTRSGGLPRTLEEIEADREVWRGLAERAGSGSSSVKELGTY